MSVAVRHLPCTYLAYILRSMHHCSPDWFGEMGEGRSDEVGVDPDQREAGARGELHLARVHVQHVHVAPRVQQQVQHPVQPRRLAHALTAGKHHAKTLCGWWNQVRDVKNERPPPMPAKMTMIWTFERVKSERHFASVQR